MSNAKQKQELQTGGATAPAEPQGSSLVHMIERVVKDPNVDVEKVERLYAMYQTEMARQAESAFNAALTAAQSEMRRVAADAENPQTRSKYASYAALDRVLRPIYTSHGFALSFDTGDAPEGHIRVLCYVSHTNGHSRTYHRDVPVTTTGIQGKTNMTLTHASASAESYGRRYLLKGIFNVAVGEDDDDGNGAGNPEDTKPVTEEQVSEIEARIDALLDSGKMSDSKPFFDWLKREYNTTNLADLTQQAYPDVCAMLERKEKGKASKKKAGAKEGS